MIQKRMVCVCDICGHIEDARTVFGKYNETDYTPPEGWSKGTVAMVDICPACTQRLAEEHEDFRIQAAHTARLNENRR